MIVQWESNCSGNGRNILKRPINGIADTTHPPAAAAVSDDDGPVGTRTHA